MFARSSTARKNHQTCRFLSLVNKHHHKCNICRRSIYFKTDIKFKFVQANMAMYRFLSVVSMETGMRERATVANDAGLVCFHSVTSSPSNGAVFTKTMAETCGEWNERLNSSTETAVHLPRRPVCLFPGAKEKSNLLSFAKP